MAGVGGERVVAMDPSLDVAAHYSSGGTLLADIEAGIAAMGLTRQTVTADDLGPVDEFHVGGRPATIELVEHLAATSASELLDIGCGIGGTGRFIASTSGARVTGVDLTPEYVDVARTLSEWTALDHLVDFEVASAVDMPFDDEAFDGASQLHVGMNIADKAALFAEVHRVLRPGARFALYDIMAMSAGDVTFPVPWAGDDSSSFLADVASYREHLEAAGFDVLVERNRGSFAAEFFETLRERSAGADGPPPLGLHLMMGPDAPTKIGNMITAITAGVIAPVELICHRT
jgi:SAM-dependent methyltransferase